MIITLSVRGPLIARILLRILVLITLTVVRPLIAWISWLVRVLVITLSVRSYPLGSRPVTATYRSLVYVRTIYVEPVVIH